MFYYRRASPKRCNNMTEVDYGGGGHRTRLRNDLKDQLVCLEVPPCPVYKGAKGEGCAGQERHAREATPSGSRIPPPPQILFQLGFPRGKEREREGKGGAAPPPCPIRTRGGGGARPALGRPSSSPLWAHVAH